jgi:hypothetical protein
MDKLAVSASTVCAIYCLYLLFILGVRPAISATLLGEQAFCARCFGLCPSEPVSSFLGVPKA